MENHDLFGELNAYKFVVGTRNEEDPFVSQTKALVLTKESPSKSPKQLSNNVILIFVNKFWKFMRKYHKILKILIRKK